MRSMKYFLRKLVEISFKNPAIFLASILSKMHLTLNKKVQISLVQLFDKHFLLYLSAKQADWFSSMPIQPEPQQYSQKFKFVPKTRSETKKLRYKTCTHTVLAIIIFLQLTFGARFNFGNAPNIFDKFLAFFCLWCNGIQTCYLQFSRLNQYNLESFLNSILKFSRKNTDTLAKPKEQSDGLETFKLVLVPMLMISITIFVPCFVFGLHWINPCKPSLLGYFLLEECYNNTNLYQGYLYLFIRVVFKLCICILNVWMWYFSAFCVCFFTSAISLISPLILSKSITSLWYKLRATGDIPNYSKGYREIQILNSLYNEVQKHLLGILIVGAIFCVTTNLTLLIKSLNGSILEVSYIIMSTSILAVLNSGAAMLLVLSAFVSVHKKSKQLLQDVKGLECLETSRASRRWARKYWRSCEKIKIKFGDYNFVEELTPIRCLDFTANITVQMLILATITK